MIFNRDVQNYPKLTNFPSQPWTFCFSDKVENLLLNHFDSCSLMYCATSPDDTINYIFNPEKELQHSFFLQVQASCLSILVTPISKLFRSLHQNVESKGRRTVSGAQNMLAKFFTHVRRSSTRESHSFSNFSRVQTCTTVKGYGITRMLAQMRSCVLPFACRRFNTLQFFLC